jgi:hypothetical protein
MYGGLRSTCSALLMCMRRHAAYMWMQLSLLFLLQVDGCTASLDAERSYYRRRNACSFHVAALEAQMDGRAVRFCRQCSK